MLILSWRFPEGVGGQKRKRHNDVFRGGKVDDVVPSY